MNDFGGVRHARSQLGFLSVELIDSPDLPRENWIVTDTHTVIDGGATEARVSPGDLIGADVLVCRHQDDHHFLKLVASAGGQLRCLA